MSDRPKCDPMILRNLRAELHQHRGGHMPEVQADVGKLGTVAARVIYHALQGQRASLNQARAQPWRKIR